jgi:hypothetical protein
MTKGELSKRVREFCDLVENGYFKEADSYIHPDSPYRPEILEWERTGGLTQYLASNHHQAPVYSVFTRDSLYIPIDLEH